MAKIPKYIQKKMRLAAKKFDEGAKIMKQVDGWFDSRGIDSALVRNGDGYSLEEIEYGNDVTERFVKWFEENF